MRLHVSLQLAILPVLLFLSHQPSCCAGPKLPGFHACVGGGGEKQEPAWYKEKGIIRQQSLIVAVVAKII